jgi:predicted PurR-regulated permease PerM
MGNKFESKSIEFYVKTALVFLIIYACFMIFKPFLLPVVWGVIIAVSLHPLHKRLTKQLKNKSGLSATILVLILLTIIIIPSISFSDSLISSIKDLSTQMKDGSWIVPAPPDTVAEWPLIGKKTYAIWQLFSDNMTAGLEKYSEQIKNAGEKLIPIFSSFVGGLLIFVISIIIAGVFLSKSSHGYRFVYTLVNALVGEKGSELVDNSKATISSVVIGVLGTAVIQTTIISLALFVFKVPGAAVITLIVLFFAIAQLPAIVIVLPVIIYMLPELSGIGAVIFVVWGITGALSDNFLKPILLGRGMKIPMLVILIGSIGGMMMMGIIGLFIGAVIMALGYQLFHLWIENAKEELEQAKAES